MIGQEPPRLIPASFRPPRRPLRLGPSSYDLLKSPVLDIQADGEGWPVCAGVTDANSLASRLLEARCMFASGDTAPLWKLLPPHVGAALAHLPPGGMVKWQDTWWSSLSNGSLMVRRGRDYGHLCQVARPLIAALADAGFCDIGFPNSPGSIASCILINYAALPNLCQGEIPRAVLQLAHQCDKGGRMEALQLGTFDHVYCYDFTAAYAAVLADLPDAGHCVWVQDKEYHRDASYGFLRVRLNIPAEYSVSPVAFRALLSDQQKDLEGLRFVTGEMEVCLIKPEFDLAVAQGCRAEILDAWWGYSENGERPFAALVAKMFALRQQHPALSGDLKLLLNAMIGQMSSAHSNWDSLEMRSQESVSPCWNSVYAGYIRGIQRVKLFQAMEPEGVVCLTIDGLITTAPMRLAPGRGLGMLRLDGEGPATILTDYAKDRPGHPPLWRDAACSGSVKSNRFTLNLSYQAGLSAYNQWPLQEAHHRIGRMIELETEFPIGSATRTAPAGVMVADLLREAIPTQSMGVTTWRDLKAPVANNYLKK